MTIVTEIGKIVYDLNNVLCIDYYGLLASKWFAKCAGHCSCKTNTSLYSHGAFTIFGHHKFCNLLQIFIFQHQSYFIIIFSSCRDFLNFSSFIL